MTPSTAKPRLLVVGDLMLDRYTFGVAGRISPEAPVPVLEADHDEVRLGGAASVAQLLRGLEADVTLAGVVGNDPVGHTLRRLVEESGINGAGIVVDPGRPTTCKERYLGRGVDRAAGGGNQMLRVDRESRAPLGAALSDQLARFVASQLRRHAALLISDYDKGVCTPAVLQRLIAMARGAGVPVLVDPARIADYGRYRGATLLKPNRIETALATGRAIHTPADALQAARKLRRDLDLQSVVVTLDYDGLVYVASAVPDEPASVGSAVSDEHVGSARRDEPAFVGSAVPDEPERLLQPTHTSPVPNDCTAGVISTTPRAIHDITGAGDTVLAVLGWRIALGDSLESAATLANRAAGLQVERLGVAVIPQTELLATAGRADDRSPPCEGGAGGVARPNDGPPTPPSRRQAASLLTLPEAAALAAQYRQAGRKVVFTNGCFDLLHVGHVTYLEQARRLGDVLFVAVNSDASVRRLKGPSRPVVPQEQRAALLGALACVDHVLIFEELTPHVLLEAIRPDLLVKGGSTVEIVGREIVERYGGRAVRLDAVGDVSTTAIVTRIQQRSLATVSSR